MKGSEEENNTGKTPIIMEEDEAKDMDLCDLDLDSVEEECRKAGSNYVSRDQSKLLQQEII